MTEDPTFERRLRSAFAATSRDDAPTPDCPPAHEIWEAVVEELDPVRLRRLIAHVALCPACTESWRLASEIARDGASEAARARSPDAGDRRVRWAGWASAAAAVLGFGLFSITYDWTPSAGSIGRSTDAEVRVLALAPPEVGASASECRVRWTEFEGATYNVQLLTAGLELIAERFNLTEPRLLIPEESLASLPAGSELRVHIAVKRGLAGVVADGTFDFRCAS